ncbi:ABC transporter substrate-binding protein [Antarcticimicrobium luteum]|nr:ABC transporter substrate-binding protein [Antarcticimicrobium luteum]
MTRLIPRIETAIGLSISPMIDLNPAIPQRISAGEEYDIGLTNPHYARELIAGGHADGASHRAFGRVPLAVGRKAGPETAILGGEQEIKALLRAARSIGYTGTGTSGRTYLDVVERLGLTGVVLPRSRAMGGGEPVASVAAGDTDLAIAPLSTILSTPGLVPAAVFPDKLGTHIDMSIFFSATPRSGAAAAFGFLSASDLDDELRAAGILRFELD